MHAHRAAHALGVLRTPPKEASPHMGEPPHTLLFTKAALVVLVFLLVLQGLKLILQALNATLCHGIVEDPFPHPLCPCPVPSLVLSIRTALPVDLSCSRHCRT